MKQARQSPQKFRTYSSSSSHHQPLPNQDLSDAIATSAFHFDRTVAEAALQQFGAHAIRRTLSAYIEPPLNDTVPGTGSRGDLTDETDEGTPPDFVIPLPLRTRATPDNLIQYTYGHRVQTCHDMPGKFPIDRGLQYDSVSGHPIVWNVGDDPMPDDFPQQEAPYCPVELDPFLPWIHDVFPSVDGTRIEFVAQNKRRCRTGAKFTNEVNRLVPQVALMQPITVQRINEATARQWAPELWYPQDKDENEYSQGERHNAAVRYRLAPRNESDPDAQQTRFICRFHAVVFSSNAKERPRSVVVGETLSGYPFNYEFVAFRKSKSMLLTPKGKDSRLFWTSNIRFHCPVPNDTALRQHIAAGNLVLSDGSPTLYVDLVPIRTSTRYAEIYLTKDEIGAQKLDPNLVYFDPVTRWGPRNVLPRVEASGRWENIPVCLPPKVPPSISNQVESNLQQQARQNVNNKNARKPHFLAACLWASTEYLTRGLMKGAHTDTTKRLREWIEFHLLAGFDHFYLYDNSGAHTNGSNLEFIVDMYPSKVTRIEWPSIVCNNNIPAHDSSGERSSQYAAENSCRTRIAPFTEWIAVFDTDEYFVPMGNFSSLRQVLENAETKGTKVLTFRSSRGKLRLDKSVEVEDSNRKQMSNVTFLEAYNCDSGGTPKPLWADRARKQIYRSDYVLYHFVHYSTVTQDILTTWAKAKETGAFWSRNYQDKRGNVQRVTDERNEAVMVHTKTILQDQTFRYNEKCHKDFKRKWLGCWVAYPWPNNQVKKEDKAYDANGTLYNCFVNEKVENYWVPKLRSALEERAANLARNNFEKSRIA